MSTVVISIAVSVLTLALLVLLGACVEMFRDIRQIRDTLGILDNPMSLPLRTVGQKLPTGLLPAQVTDQPRSLVLFVGVRCGTCFALTEALATQQMPNISALYIVIEASTEEAAQHWLTDRGLDIGERAIYDRNERISHALEIVGTPVAIVVERGTVIRATTVPSTRQLRSLLTSLSLPTDAPVKIMSRPKNWSN